jgi:FKBP-type peptidyl-prolyl cis-trans isomerase (trigger factor)
MIEPDTAFLRLPLLFDHAAGAVDFRLDIALPRLVEGLDLGEQGTVPLPEFAGRGRRFAIGGKPDPLGLAPHLAGIAVGETREVTLRLPDSLEDRALAGRQARFTLHATALLRRVVPAVDAALAQALGHADLAALRGFVARAVAARHAALSDRVARRALLDALLAATGDFALPAPALQQEVAALQARMPRAAPQAIEALAARRLREGLLLGAVARRYGLATGTAAVAFLLARAQVTERVFPAAELAAGAA